MGVKVVLMLHCCPAATELPQVLVWAKSPVTEMPVTPSAVVRLLVRVTESGLLVVPIVRLVKVSWVAERVTEFIPSH